MAEKRKKRRKSRKSRLARACSKAHLGRNLQRLLLCLWCTPWGCVRCAAPKQREKDSKGWKREQRGIYGTAETIGITFSPCVHVLSTCRPWDRHTGFWHTSSVKCRCFERCGISALFAGGSGHRVSFNCFLTEQFIYCRIFVASWSGLNDGIITFIF